MKRKKPVVRSAPSGQGRTTRGRKTVPSLQVNKVRRTNFRRIFYPERSNPAAEPSGTASGPSSSVEPRKPRKRRPVRGTEKIAASLRGSVRGVAKQSAESDSPEPDDPEEFLKQKKVGRALKKLHIAFNASHTSASPAVTVGRKSARERGAARDSQRTSESAVKRHARATLKRKLAKNTSRRPRFTAQSDPDRDSALTQAESRAKRNASRTRPVQQTEPSSLLLTNGPGTMLPGESVGDSRRNSSTPVHSRGRGKARVSRPRAECTPEPMQTEEDASSTEFSAGLGDTESTALTSTPKIVRTSQRTKLKHSDRLPGAARRGRGIVARAAYRGRGVIAKAVFRGRGRRRAMLNRPVPTKRDVSEERDTDTNETVSQSDEQASKGAASPVVSRCRPRKRSPAMSESMESVDVEMGEGAEAGWSENTTKKVKPRRRKDIAVSVQSHLTKERSASMECLVPGEGSALEQVKVCGQSRSSSPGGMEGKAGNNDRSLFAVDLTRSSSLDNLLRRPNSESDLHPLLKSAPSRESVHGDFGVEDGAGGLVNSKAGSSSSPVSQPGTSFSSKDFYSLLKRKRSGWDEIPGDMKKKRLMKRLRDISTEEMPAILPPVRTSRVAASGRSPAVSRESSPGTLPKVKGTKLAGNFDGKESVMETGLDRQRNSAETVESSLDKTRSGETCKKDEAKGPGVDGVFVMNDGVELAPETPMTDAVSTQSCAVAGGKAKSRPKEPQKAVSGNKDCSGQIEDGSSKDVEKESFADVSNLDHSYPTAFVTVLPSFKTSGQSQDSHAASTTSSVPVPTACTTKRPRGRPRNPHKVDRKGGTGRGRGRPKGSPSKAKLIVKRKPGRPRKADSSAELNERKQGPPTGLSGSPLKRKRGRQTSEEKLLQKHWNIGAYIVGSGGGGVKRSPGRPRKVPRNSESARQPAAMGNAHGNSLQEFIPDRALPGTRPELSRDQSAEDEDLGSVVNEAGQEMMATALTAPFDSGDTSGSASKGFTNNRTVCGSDRNRGSRLSSRITVAERRKACPTLAQMRRMRKRRKKSRWASGMLPKQSLTAMNRFVRLTKQSSVPSYFAPQTSSKGCGVADKTVLESKEKERVGLVSNPTTELTEVHLPQVTPKAEPSDVKESQIISNAESSDVTHAEHVPDFEHPDHASLIVHSQPNPNPAVEHSDKVPSDALSQSETTGEQSESRHSLPVTSEANQPQAVNQSSDADQSQVIPDLTQAIPSTKRESPETGVVQENVARVAKPKGRSRELKRLQTDEGAQRIMSWHEKKKLKSVGLLLRSKTKDDEADPKPSQLKTATDTKERKSNKLYSIAISDTRLVFKSGQTGGKEEAPELAEGADVLPAGAGLPAEELAAAYEQEVVIKFKRGLLSTSSSLDSEDRLPPIITEVTPFGDNRSERSRSEELSPPPLIRPEDPYSEDYFLSMPVSFSGVRGQEAKSKPLDTDGPEGAGGEVDAAPSNQAVASDAKAESDTVAGIDVPHGMETSGTIAVFGAQTPVKLVLKRKRGRPAKRRGAQIGPASRTGREPHVKPGPASSKSGRKPSAALKTDPTYTQNAHHVPSEPRTFALRPKTTRSPLEIIALRQKQEEEQYELQEATRLARIQKRRQAQHGKLVIASEPASQPMGTCKPCSVVLVDFVKKLHLHSIDTSDQYVSDVSYDSDEKDLDDEYDDFSDADYDPKPDEADMAEDDLAELAAISKTSGKEQAARKPSNAAHAQAASKEMQSTTPTEIQQKISPTDSQISPTLSADVQKMSRDLDCLRGKGFLGNFVDFIENRGNHDNAPFAKPRYTSRSPAAASNAASTSAACNMPESSASKAFVSPISASPLASVSAPYQIVTAAQIHMASQDLAVGGCPEVKAVSSTAPKSPATSSSPHKAPEPSHAVGVRPEDEAVSSSPSKCLEPARDARVYTEDEAVSSSPSRAPEHGTDGEAEKPQSLPLAKSVAEKSQSLGKLKVFPTKRDGDGGAFDKTATTRYLCTKCDFSATNKGTIESHVYRHIPGVNFKCGYCESEFTGLISALTHVKNSHNSKDPKVWISKDINEASLYTEEELGSCSVPGFVAPPDARHQKAGLADPATMASQMCDPPASTQPVIISLVVSGDMAMQRPDRFSSSPLATQRRFACTHCSYTTSVMEDAHQHVRDLHRGSSLYTCYLCDKAMGCSLQDVSAHCQVTHPHRRNSFKQLPDFYDQELIRGGGSAGDQPKPKQDRGNIFDIFESRGFSSLAPGSEVTEDGQLSPQARFLRAREYLYIQEGWSKKTSAEADSTTIEDIEIPLEDSSEADTVGLDSTSEGPCVAQQSEENIDRSLAAVQNDKQGRSAEVCSATPVDCTANSKSSSRLETVDSDDKRESTEIAVDKPVSAVDSGPGSGSLCPSGKEDTLKASYQPEGSESQGPQSLPADSEGGASSLTTEDVSETSSRALTTSSQLPDHSEPAVSGISSSAETSVSGEEVQTSNGADEDVSAATGSKADAAKDAAQTGRDPETPAPHLARAGSCGRDEVTNDSSSSAAVGATSCHQVALEDPVAGPSDVGAEVDDDGDADGDILVINLDDDVMEDAVDESCSTPEEEKAERSLTEAGAESSEVTAASQDEDDMGIKILSVVSLRDGAIPGMSHSPTKAAPVSTPQRTPTHPALRQPAASQAKPAVSSTPEPHPSASPGRKSATPSKGLPEVNADDVAARNERLACTYKCHECNVHSPALGAIVEHLKQHHHDVPLFSCPYCKSKKEPFYTEEQVHIHVIDKHPSNYAKNEVSLSERAKSFVQVLALPSGRRSKGALIEQDIYMCRKCEAHVPDLDYAHQHVKVEHPGLLYYACATCGTFVDSAKEAVKTHMCEVHGLAAEPVQLPEALEGVFLTKVVTISQNGQYHDHSTATPTKSPASRPTVPVSTSPLRSGAPSSAVALPAASPAAVQAVPVAVDGSALGATGNVGPIGLVPVQFNQVSPLLLAPAQQPGLEPPSPASSRRARIGRHRPGNPLSTVGLLLARPGALPLPRPILPMPTASPQPAGSPRKAGEPGQAHFQKTGMTVKDLLDSRQRSVEGSSLQPQAVPVAVVTGVGAGAALTVSVSPPSSPSLDLSVSTAAPSSQTAPSESPSPRRMFPMTDRLDRLGRTRRSVSPHGCSPSPAATTAASVSRPVLRVPQVSPVLDLTSPARNNAHLSSDTGTSGSALAGRAASAPTQAASRNPSNPLPVSSLPFSIAALTATGAPSVSSRPASSSSPASMVDGENPESYKIFNLKPRTPVALPLRAATASPAVVSAPATSHSSVTSQSAMASHSSLTSQSLLTSASQRMTQPVSFAPAAVTMASSALFPQQFPLQPFHHVQTAGISTLPLGQGIMMPINQGEIAVPIDRSQAQMLMAQSPLTPVLINSILSQLTLPVPVLQTTSGPLPAPAPAPAAHQQPPSGSPAAVNLSMGQQAGPRLAQPATKPAVPFQPRLVQNRGRGRPRLTPRVPPPQGLQAAPRSPAPRPPTPFVEQPPQALPPGSSAPAAHAPRAPQRQGGSQQCACPYCPETLKPWEVAQHILVNHPGKKVKYNRV